MLDANQLINNLKSQYYKKGYKIDELPEIKAVYDLLERSNLPKGNFLMQLQNLIILKQENIDNTAAGYNPKTNTITYANEIDLIHELFHMASTENESKTCGITQYEDGIVQDEDGTQIKVKYGLDEGITDMFAEMANSNVPCGYPFERMCAEMLRNIFGLQIFKGYFENSYDKFLGDFPEEVQELVEDLVSTLDEYQDLTKLIYSGDSTIEDVTSLEELTEYIMETLTEIAETMGKEKSEVMTFFSEKANDSSMQSIRELVKFDNAIQNISSKGL